MRAAIDRALTSKPTGRELRVLLAVISLISCYDRTEDTIANRQIAEATGLDKSHVRRCLRSLAEKEVFDRTPGCGRTASRVAFPIPESELVEPTSEGAALTPSEEAGSAPTANRPPGRRAPPPWPEPCVGCGGKGVVWVEELNAAERCAICG